MKQFVVALESPVKHFCSSYDDVSFFVIHCDNKAAALARAEEPPCNCTNDLGKRYKVIFAEELTNEKLAAIVEGFKSALTFKITACSNWFNFVHNHPNWSDSKVELPEWQRFDEASYMLTAIARVHDACTGNYTGRQIF